jgi:hypothetical protein
MLFEVSQSKALTVLGQRTPSLSAKSFGAHVRSRKLFLIAAWASQMASEERFRALTLTIFRANREAGAPIAFPMVSWLG